MTDTKNLNMTEPAKAVTATKGTKNLNKKASEKTVKTRPTKDSTQDAIKSRVAYLQHQTDLINIENDYLDAKVTNMELTIKHVNLATNYARALKILQKENS